MDNAGPSQTASGTLGAVGPGAFTVKRGDQCIASTQTGERCQRPAWRGSSYCGGHQPVPEVAASSHVKARRKAQAAADREAAAALPLPFANLRYCTGISAKSGLRCRMPALKDGELCRNHAKKPTEIVVAREIKRTQREGREHLLKAIKLEIGKDPRRVFNVLFEGLEANRQTWDPEEHRHVESDQPDWDVRLQCFRELADRIYGKPTGKTEITGAAGGPITIAAIVGDADTFRQVLEAGDQEAWYETIEDAEEVPPDVGEASSGTILAPGLGAGE